MMERGRCRASRQLRAALCFDDSIYEDVAFTRAALAAIARREQDLADAPDYTARPGPNEIPS